MLNLNLKLNKKLSILLIGLLLTLLTVFFYNTEIVIKCPDYEVNDIRAMIPCDQLTHEEVGFPFHFLWRNGDNVMGIPSNTMVNPEFTDIFKFLRLFGAPQFWLNFIFWSLTTTGCFVLYSRFKPRKNL